MRGSSNLAKASPQGKFMPSIERNSSVPYYLQVYDQIARGIDTGLYPAGCKLPSIRECARELGVSNTTIELAYQKLTSEGYVQARRGSGYTVCQIGKAPTGPALDYQPAYLDALERIVEDEALRQSARPARYDFAYDAVDPATFPFNAWARISREVLFSKGVEAACLYNDQQGLRALRDEIARYLGIEYNLDCVAEQVLVMPTTRDLVSAVTSLFDAAETTIAMEEPGYDEVGRKLAAHGFTVKRITVFPSIEWDEYKRQLQGCKLVFTTPACQFPTNRVMPIELRRNLVDWAQRTDAYVIDDEYGWEFQTGTGRIPPLGSLDTTGRIVTFGTFSNSFTPALCLSYAALPPELVLRWRACNHDAHPQVPWQTQAAMAAFMRDEHWRAHVRRIRTAIYAKRTALADALAEHMGDRVDVVIGPSSLFALVQTRDGRTEDELVSAAATADVRVYPTRRYWSGPVPDTWRYVLVGYSGIPLADIAPGVNALAGAWFADAAT